MLPPPRNAGAHRPPPLPRCARQSTPLTGKVLHGAHFPMKSFCFCWESFPPFTGPATIQMSDSVFRLNYENTIQLWFFASSPGVDAFSFLHRPDHRGSRFRRHSAFGPGTQLRPNSRAARNPGILIRTMFRLHYVICRAGAKAKANRNTKLTRTRRFHIGTETRPTPSFRISTRWTLRPRALRCPARR